MLVQNSMLHSNKNSFCYLFRLSHHSSIKIRRVVAKLLLVSVLAGSSAAGNARFSNAAVPPIEYGYPDQSIFVATTNSQGQPDSPMLYLAEALMEKAGIPWQATPYPAKRLFSNLERGTTNFSILVRASSLKDCCLFSKKPVYTTMLNIYFIGDKPSVKSRNDLVGKKVITIRGYSYGGLLTFISYPANQIVNEIADTHKAAFKMLESERADYLLDYASAADDILADSPIENINLNSLSRLDIFLVLSKAYPDAEELMKKLEAIVKTLNVDEVLKGR